MHSKGERSKRALADIDMQFRMIDAFLACCDEVAFLDNPKAFYAVTRSLEIISEASRRLP